MGINGVILAKHWEQHLKQWNSLSLRTVAHQAPLSIGFSRQAYWSGLPCPPPADLPNPFFHLWLFNSFTYTALIGICIQICSISALFTMLLKPDVQVDTQQDNCQNSEKQRNAPLSWHLTESEQSWLGCLPALLFCNYLKDNMENITGATHLFLFHLAVPSGLLFIQSHSHVWLLATSWTAIHQASLSFTISWSFLNFMSVEVVMPSKHLVLCGLWVGSHQLREKNSPRLLSLATIQIATVGSIDSRSPRLQ